MARKRRPRPAGRKPDGAKSLATVRVAWWAPGVAALVAVLCYVQTARFDFVWDDNVQIVLNPRIRGFSHLGEAFTENFWAFSGAGSFSNYYRPFQTVAYMLAYAVGGLEPSTYHAFCILLNTAATLAVFWLGWELFRSGLIALGGALLFATHPMHTESVAWIAGITDVGCGLFYFLALACHLRRCRETRHRGLWAFLSAASFAGALFFKEMAFTLPLAVLMLDLAVQRERVGLFPRLVRLAPHAAVFLGYAALRMTALKGFAQTVLPLPLSPVDRILTMLHFTGSYLGDLLLPFAQNAFHVFLPASRLTAAELAWSFGLLLLYSAALWLLLRKRDYRLLFSCAFVLLAIVPVLFLGGTGQNMYAERYLYIPSAGYCLALAVVVDRLLRSRAHAIVAVAVLAAGFGILTLRRNAVWQDNKVFYTATIEVSPDAVIAQNDLGKIHFDDRDFEAARQCFSRALEADGRAFVPVPRNRATSFLGLSAIASAEGRLEEAWDLAQRAMDTAPDLADCYSTAGMLRGKQGRLREAELLLRKALELQPTNVTAHMNLGNVLLLQGRSAEAEQEIMSGVELDPRSRRPRVVLAYLYWQTGRPAEAAKILREVLAADPGFTQARQLLEQVSATPAR